MFFNKIYLSEHLMYEKDKFYKKIIFKFNIFSDNIQDTVISKQKKFSVYKSKSFST